MGGKGHYELPPPGGLLPEKTFLFGKELPKGVAHVQVMGQPIGGCQVIWASNGTWHKFDLGLNEDELTAMHVAMRLSCS